MFLVDMNSKHLMTVYPIQCIHTCYVFSAIVLFQKLCDRHYILKDLSTVFDILSFCVRIVRALKLLVHFENYVHFVACRRGLPTYHW